MIKEKFPQKTLKAMPNIQSRVKLFRSKTTSPMYYALVVLFRTMKIALSSLKKVNTMIMSRYILLCVLLMQGICFAFPLLTFFCITIQNHKEATGLYGKSFPFFNDLAPVFTKDRAQGDVRGDLGDNANQHLHENISLNKNKYFSQILSDDFFMSIDEPIGSSSPTTANDNVLSSGYRKRKNRIKEQILR